MHSTSLGTVWRFTAESGIRFTVAIGSPAVRLPVDPEGPAWAAFVNDHHVFPEHGGFWPSEEAALGGAEQWIWHRRSTWAALQPPEVRDGPQKQDTQLTWFMESAGASQLAEYITHHRGTEVMVHPDQVYPQRGLPPDRCCRTNPPDKK